MYLIKNKLLSVNIIIIFVAISINAKKMPLSELSAGDTINIKDLDEKSTEIYGDIFNGYNGTRFIGITSFKGFSPIAIYKKFCLNLDSFKSYFYSPKITINDKEFDPLLIFKNNYQSIYNSFDIDTQYIDKMYSYGIAELCRINKIQNLKIKVINENYISLINDQIGYKILYNTTGILRFKRNNETHYVSSITTGSCLLQAFVNKADACVPSHDDASKTKNFKNFFESFIYKSHIISVNDNNAFGKKLNDHLPQASLLNYINLTSSLQHEISSYITKDTAVAIDFCSLPKLPTKELPIVNIASLADLEPGDIINMNDDKTVEFLFNFGMHNDSYSHTTAFSLHNYTNCNEKDNKKLELELTQLNNRDKSEEFIYKVDVFEKRLKSHRYGVDRKYLNSNYKCFKITICSGFERQTYNNPILKLTNLYEFSNNHKYNILENEDIVLFYKKTNKTYYVTRTEKGDCLFQALIYPASVSIDDVIYFRELPMYRGKIILASNDVILESWMKIFLASDPANIYESLLTSRANIIGITLPIINNLNAHKVLINLYLKEIN